MNFPGAAHKEENQFWEAKCLFWGTGAALETRLQLLGPSECSRHFDQLGQRLLGGGWPPGDAFRKGTLI